MSKYIDGTLTVYFNNSSGDLTIPGTMAIGTLSTATQQTAVISSLVINTSTIITNFLQTNRISSLLETTSSMIANNVSSLTSQTGQGTFGTVSTLGMSLSSLAAVGGKFIVTGISNDEAITAGFLHYNTTTKEVVYNSQGGGGGGGGVLLTASTMIGTNSIIAPNQFYAQELYTTNAYDYSQFGASFTQTATSQQWAGVCMSANGQYMLAAPDNGFLYSSSNFGSTWIPVGTSQGWGCVAMNASGRIQIAAIGIAGSVNAGNIYISQNYGNTWAILSGSPFTYWIKLTVSASGQYMSGIDNASGFETDGYIYTSSDFGTTWTQNTNAPLRTWSYIRMSASGQIQTATSHVTNGAVYISTDYGQTWTITSLTNDNFFSVAISGSGQYQTVCSATFPGGHSSIFVSSNYGATWTMVVGPDTGNNYLQVSMSASGQYQMTIVPFLGVYQSSNYGTTWTLNSAPVYDYTGMDMSAAGNITVVVSTGPQYIYINRIPLVLQNLITNSLTTSNATTDSLLTNSISPFHVSWQTTTPIDAFNTGLTPALNQQGNNFTLECYVYPTLNGTFNSVLSVNNGVAANGHEFRIYYNGPNGFGLLFPNGASSDGVQTGANVALDNWYHLALVRVGTTITLYLNGTSWASATMFNYTTSENRQLQIFSTPYGDPHGQGNINSVRFTIGQALYTGAFTPPTQQLTTTSVGTSGANVAASITGSVAFLGAVTNSFTDQGPKPLPIIITGTPIISLTTPPTFTNTVTINSGISTPTVQVSALTASSITASSVNTAIASISTAIISTAQVRGVTVSSATISSIVANNVSSLTSQSGALTTSSILTNSLFTNGAVTMSNLAENNVLMIASTQQILTSNSATGVWSYYSSAPSGPDIANRIRVGSYSGGGQAFTINEAGGNVGIGDGMYNPLYTLDVVGTANFLSTLTRSASISTANISAGQVCGLSVSSLTVSSIASYFEAPVIASISTANISTANISTANISTAQVRGLTVSSLTVSSITTYYTNTTLANISTLTVSSIGATRFSGAVNMVGLPADSVLMTTPEQQILLSNPNSTISLYANAYQAAPNRVRFFAYGNGAGAQLTLNELGGNVGIGNGMTNPQYTLDVVGTANFLSTLTKFASMSTVNISTAQILGMTVSSATFSSMNTTIANISVATVSTFNAGTNVQGNFTLTGATAVTIPTLGSGYRAMGLSGGNSAGYIYGAFQSLGDGIHLSYNYINCNLGNTSNYIPKVDGRTSQINIGYGLISFDTSITTNTIPTERLRVHQNGNVGINCNAPQYTLDVNGTINASIGVRSNGTFLTSDRRIKEFITDANLDICYSNVKNLSLRRYAYISTFKTTKLDGNQIGFIADEVQSVFPKSVKDFPTTVDPKFSSIKHMNYDQIFLAHYGATQKLMNVVEQQSTQIAKLLADNSTLTSMCAYIPQLINTVSTLKG